MNVKLSLVLLVVHFFLLSTCEDHHQEEEADAAWDEIFGGDQHETAEHLKEELPPAYDFGALFGMSFEEVQFLLYTTHDLDKNGKLDGLELLKSIHHSNYSLHNHSTTDNDHDNQPQPHATGHGTGNAGVHAGLPSAGSGHAHGHGGQTSTIHLEEDAGLVDAILLQDDLNKDGLLDYTEFSKAKARNPKNKAFKHL